MSLKTSKTSVELILVRCELKGVPERRLPLSRNLTCVDLIWPRVGIAKKSAAREVRFRRGCADFTAERWLERCLMREEIEGHCGLAVTITEPVSVQKIRRFLRLAAKYALKEGAGFVEDVLTGYASVASSPVKALAQLVGEKDTPKPIARGFLDLEALPAPGETHTVEIPLVRPLTGKDIGSLTLELRAQP